MDNLPLELYHNIFSYADIYDLFNLRLLNKKFKLILSHYRIKELIVFNPQSVFNLSEQSRFPSQHRNFVRYKSVWFNSDRPKNFLNLVDESKAFLLKNPADSPLFSLKFLRRLKVDHFKGRSTFILQDAN